MFIKLDSQICTVHFQRNSFKRLELNKTKSQLKHCYNLIHLLSLSDLPNSQSLYLFIIVL
jgi:hypothetical protein